MDFVSDTLSNGRRFRCLTIMDEFSRECMAIHVAHSIPATGVIEVVERLKQSRGLPEVIITDNGSEAAVPSIQGSVRKIATRHGVPHSLLAIWIRKYEAGELAEEVYLQEQVSEYEARIGALERKIGQLTMELDVMKKRALIRPSDQSARPSIISGPGACPSDEDVAS